MVSKDQEPVPLSDQKYIDIFTKSMQEWGMKMQNNEEGYLYGGVDLVNLNAKPYGEAY